MKIPIKYSGPPNFADDISLALGTIASKLIVNLNEHECHCTIEATGLDNRVDIINGISVYLVGAIAGCIDFNLSLRSALFNESSLIRDLYNDVIRVIFDRNDIDNELKIYDRNPWIWEGISHLILHLSILNNLYHPPDRLLMKSSIHLNVKDHGLDIIALYGSDSLGITAGECKAYLSRPADAISDAAGKLEEVDNKLRDAEIRATISQFRPILRPEYQAKLTNAFWHNERAYFPMICCDKSFSRNWGFKRVSIERLKPPRNRKFLVPSVIENAEVFFDAISASMRRYSKGAL